MFTYKFTKKEQQIFNLLMLGKTKKEIASSLNMQLTTFHTHLMNIYRKAECHSMNELLIKMLKNIEATSRHIIKVEKAYEMSERRCTALEAANKKLNKELHKIKAKVEELKNAILIERLM